MEKQLSLLDIHIFVDGAARNNPGPAGAGVYITQGGKAVCKQGYHLGKKTNNQAEYLALALGLFLAQEKFSKHNVANLHLIINSDSELLVKQMIGEYRVKNPYIAQVKALIDEFLRDTSYSIKHIFREKNVMADALANQGIDTKKALPPSFVKLLIDHEVAL